MDDLAQVLIAAGVIGLFLGALVATPLAGPAPGLFWESRLPRTDARQPQSERAVRIQLALFCCATSVILLGAGVGILVV